MNVFKRFRNWWNRQFHGKKYVVYAAIEHGKRIQKVELVGRTYTYARAFDLWQAYDKQYNRITHAFMYVEKIPFGRR